MSDVVAERHGAVLVCRLDRPTAMNGLTGALLGEYLSVLEDARVDDAVRVVVTTGEGDAFSAGADVSDLSGETAQQGLNALLHERLGLTSTLSAPTGHSTDWESAGKRWRSRTTTSHSLRRSTVPRPVAASHWHAP